MALLFLRLIIAGAFLYALYQVYKIALRFAAIGRMRHIAAERGDMSGFPHFQVAFPAWNSDKLRDIYGQLQNALALDDFPVLPDDRLEDLGLQQKDVLKVIETSVRTYGGDYAAAQNKLSAEPLQSARDVVNWIGKATPSEGIEHGSL